MSVQASVIPGHGAHFFFSSRRRHTRSLRDWSSDVCSSDLLDRASWCSDQRRRRRLVEVHRKNGGQRLVRVLDGHDRIMLEIPRHALEIPVTLRRLHRELSAEVGGRKGFRLDDRFRLAPAGERQESREEEIPILVSSAHRAATYGCTRYPAVIGAAA